MVQMGPQINGLLLRAASRSSGRVSALAALPCPGTAQFLSTQTDTTFALNIGTGSDWKNLPGTAQFLSTQTDTTFALNIGTGSDWKNLSGTAQFLSTQTDTTFALIYKIYFLRSTMCLGNKSLSCVWEFVSILIEVLPIIKGLRFSY
jgi:hypothetical protein